MRRMYCFSSNDWPVAAKYCACSMPLAQVVIQMTDERLGRWAEVVHVPDTPHWPMNLKQAPLAMLNGVPVSVVGVIVLPSGLVTAPVAIMCRVKIEFSRRV